MLACKRHKVLSSDRVFGLCQKSFFSSVYEEGIYRSHSAFPEHMMDLLNSFSLKHLHLLYDLLKSRFQKADQQAHLFGFASAAARAGAAGGRGDSDKADGWVEGDSLSLFGSLRRGLCRCGYASQVLVRLAAAALQG